MAAAWRAGAYSDVTEDGLQTKTSREQAQVKNACRQLFDEVAELDGTLIPDTVELKKAAHIAYLFSGLGRLGEGFASLDASRPWLCYWIVHSLAVLSPEPLSASLADAVVGFIARCINTDTGGFGGGPYPGQSAHLAPTYAAINTLVTIGTPEAHAVIERARLRDFLLRMKQPDGSFTMHDDVRTDQFIDLSISISISIYLQLFCSQMGELAWIITAHKHCTNVLYMLLSTDHAALQILFQSPFLA